jgi:hypothetical protein
MAGNVIVSSTCSDAFRNSPMSKDPESEDRDRFSGPDRWLSALLVQITRLVGGCSKAPFPRVFRAWVAKSLLRWIIVNEVSFQLVFE